MEITLDTHTLIWYLDTTLNKKLSPKAIESIKEAEQAGTIYIPIIVLIELLYLIEKKQINYNFSDLCKLIEKNNAYYIIPLNMAVLNEIEALKGLEIHDRIIVACAKLTNSSLISKDNLIKNNYQDVVW